MTKKGKEFFRFSTSLTEPITRLAVADRCGSRAPLAPSWRNIAPPGRMAWQRPNCGSPRRPSTHPPSLAPVPPLSSLLHAPQGHLGVVRVRTQSLPGGPGQGPLPGAGPNIGSRGARAKLCGTTYAQSSWQPAGACWQPAELDSASRRARGGAVDRVDAARWWSGAIGPVMHSE
jgi:hypothetical protein